MQDLNAPDVATLRARAAVMALAQPEAAAFSPSRWPYTYACDHLRHRLGSRTVDSRGEASQYRQRLAEAAGLPDRFVAELLATAYCQDNNIQLPASLLTA